MNAFLKVFKFYNKPLRGLFYMSLRWAIVPFAEIESYIPKKGFIVDLGCGEGVMATLLAVTSKKRKVLGLDTNRKKIALARNLTKGQSNLSFKVKDALEDLPKAAGFVLSDFLHHLPKNKHHGLFLNIYNSLAPNGILLIKEIDTQDKIRSKFSRFFDFLFYPFETINFTSSKELTKELEKIGFKVKVLKSKKYFPGSTTIYQCIKR